MLDLFFYIMLFGGLGLFAIGIMRRSLAMAIIGSILIISTGMVLMSEGVDFPTEYNVWEDANNMTYIRTEYTTYTSSNDTGTWVLAQLLTYGGIMTLIATMVLLYYHRRED